MNDGSWDLTWSGDTIEKAVFRLAGTGEVASINAVLSHPASRGLRHLELHLTDFHLSAEPAALAVAGQERPHLEHLYFGYGYETLYERHRTSAGDWIHPEKYLNDAVVPEAAAQALWAALPALRHLELEGAFLFDSVEHPTLTHLSTRGPVISDGSLFWYQTPDLTSLTVEIGTDVHGVVGSNLQLDDLDATRYPRLTHLDLSDAEMDPEEAGDFVLLAEHPVLPQLKYLALRELVLEETDDQEPLALLTDLAPRFAHLELHIEGTVYVEGADDDEVDELIGG